MEVASLRIIRARHTLTKVNKMAIIKSTEDGNWIIIMDWAIPEEVQIEDGEIRLLRDELCQVFGLPEAAT